jgi:hypothetical protein
VPDHKKEAPGMDVDSTPKWALCTIEGFRQLSRSRYQEAAENWILSLDMLVRSATCDARLASSQTNSGVGYVMLQRMSEADSILNKAEESWERVRAAVASLEIPVVSTSSSFHFRLATKNLQTFADARRQRYARLCEASLVITRFNRFLAEANLDLNGDMESCANLLKASLAEILGARSPEVRLLSNVSGSFATRSNLLADLLAYAEKITEFECRRQTMTSAFSDECSNLEVAVGLTALLGPRLFRTIAVADGEWTEAARDLDSAPVIEG